MIQAEEDLNVIYARKHLIRKEERHWRGYESPKNSL
jgi:hypothetical protein